MSDQSSKDKKRRDDTYEVTDKPAESGIKLNNIISFLILAVMSWVGLNIESIKEHVATATKDIAVNTTRIDNLNINFNEHRRNHHKRNHKD